jgi:hypothetical protein
MNHICGEEKIATTLPRNDFVRLFGRLFQPS